MSISADVPYQGHVRCKGLGLETVSAGTMCGPALPSVVSMAIDKLACQ